MGEWVDATGLVHLRARYYAPWQGRFVSKDVWEGDVRKPMSLNSWNYVLSNPVIAIDPSGQICLWGNDIPPVNISPCTSRDIVLAGEQQKAIGQSIGVFLNRAERNRLNPVSEFIGEAFILFGAHMWEGEFVQSPIHHRETIFYPSQNTSFWDRLLASIDVSCTTAYPIALYGLIPYQWVMGFPFSPSGNLGQISDIQARQVSSLSSKYKIDVRVAGRWASTADELMVRSYAHSEALTFYEQELAKRGLTNASIDPQLREELLEFAAKQIAPKYNLQWWQVKSPTFAKELDIFINPMDFPIYQANKTAINEELMSTFGAEKVDVYNEFSDQPPPGSVLFGKDGSIWHFLGPNE